MNTNISQDMSMDGWESVIGLEVHVQLATKSKMFSSSATDFGAEPNVQANEVDLALPGTLPVANAEAIRMSVKFGLAINAEIGKYNQFVRKNYFYPDLPKGYQISQLEYPIVGKGEIKIEMEESDKVIGITRAHLEEDAGKSLHEDFHGMSGMDYNRAGTALMEIVSEPELRSAAEAVAYLKAINRLVRYLDISDGDMSRGSMRCDANVSVRKKGDKNFGQRAEIKNVNSYRFVEKAINYEVERQIALLESGERVVQETRLYDAENNETRAMRSKEESHDYRYFPDPDLLPVEVTDEMIADIKTSMVELPQQKQARFIKDFGISEYDAKILVAKLSLANYYERVQETCGDSKLAANWVTSELLGALNKEGLEIEDTPLSAELLGSLLLRIKDKTISGKIAKEIFGELFQNPNADATELAEKKSNLQIIDGIIESKGLSQISDQAELSEIAAKIIADNPQQTADFRDGKDRLFGYFVGQMMKATGGRADPKLANDILMKQLRQ